MTSLLTFKIRSKRRVSPPLDPHAFESIGSILCGMRAKAEAQMTPAFDPPLSLNIDFLVAAEQRDAEDCD